MILKSVRAFLLFGFFFVLTGCSSVDNSQPPSPLVEITKPIGKLEIAWKASGGSAEIYRFFPSVDSNMLVSGAASGQINGFDINSGQQLFSVKPEAGLSGGVAGWGELVVAGTNKGAVLAYGRLTGQKKWQTQLGSEIIASPVIANGRVVVRTGDGRIFGLEATDGKVVWQVRRSQPALILRNYASATVVEGVAYVGLAGGKLVAIAVYDGKILWESVVASSRGATELDRVSDVVSQPVVSGGHVCAVAFQGKVACFAASNGTLLWAKDVSSSAGLAIDARNVYVTDSAGALAAYERSIGRLVWRQDSLTGRRLTAPILFGKYLAVGDFEGFVHLLDAEDGALVARTATDSSKVLVAPIVNNERLIVQTESGSVYSLALR